MQLPHHLIDETILAKYGKVEGNVLVVGKCRYEYLILPKLYTMDVSTEKLLREFVKNGGRVLLTDEKPTYLEGEPFEYDYLKTNVTYEEMLAAQPFVCEVKGGDIRSMIRKDEEGRTFIYIANVGMEAGTAKFTLKTGKSFLSYDIMKDEYTPVSTSLSLDSAQSYLLYVSDEAPKAEKKLSPLTLGKKFTVVGDTENYLTLDFVCFSTDGKNYSEPLHHMGVFNEMLERRYKGKLYLKYLFNVDMVPANCELMAEDTNTLSVSVNGKKVEKIGSSPMERSFYLYDMSGCLKKGENEIVIEIDYFQSEQVYYALFGENVTESLKNCLAYDTDIEAVYVKGNFGVYGAFTQGNCEGVLLGENFRIGAPKKEIESLIEEGYPFFAGDIVLKQSVTVDDVNKELVLDKRFHLVDVKVNGKAAGRMMFSNRLDLSEYLTVGENEIELTLTVGNRNLLGAFHTQEQEPRSVGPYTFERIGTWKDGKSSILRESYALVKTIL